MKKASPSSESYLDRIRFWSSSSKANGTSQFSLNTSRPPILPLSVAQPITTKTQLPTQNNSRQLTRHVSNSVPLFPSTDVNVVYNARSSKTTANNVADNTSVDHPPPAPPPEADGQGGIIAESEKVVEKKNVVIRFGRVAKFILLSSYVNLLLIFVPVGIAVKAAALSPGIIFAMNAIAIVPLAGLLSHATESVAKRMGDTVGALMNITFGNAVELIILYVILYLCVESRLTPSSMYVYLYKRSRQERARSPLKGIFQRSSPISPLFSLPLHVPFPVISKHILTCVFL
jgi:Ca2+:H+ antiporter